MNRIQPITVGVIALLSTLLPLSQTQAGERSPGSFDTSRRNAPEPGRRPAEQGHLSAGRPDRTLLEQVDPVVRQFWSDRCVNQRASGRSHTRDCDNPAYSGGSHGWADPYGYRGYRPPYPRGDTVIINRGGTVIVPQQYGSKPQARGGLVPLPRR